MNNTKNQQGFTLIEVSIALVIMGMMILSWVQMQSHQNQRDRARAIAQIYETMNQAAGSYMVNYYPRIIDSNPNCANLPYGGQNLNANLQGPPANCNGVLPAGNAQVQIANLRQPTLAELRQLGLLDINPNGARNNVLPLPTFSGLNHQLRVVGLDGQVAPNAFHILIQNTTEQGNNVDLRSIVFNLQPYNLQNNNFGGNTLLDQILLVGGANMFLSDDTNLGQLRPAQSGEALVNIVNPISVAQNNGELVGAPHIIAMRNGYGSSGYARYLRRDGSTTLTGNWDVGNMDITNIQNLGVNQNITAGTDISARRNITADGNITAVGQVSGATGVFGALNAASQNINAAFKATSAYIQDTLRVGAGLIVDGTLDVGERTTLRDELEVLRATTLRGTLTVDGATDLRNRLTVGGRSDLQAVSAGDFRLNEAATIGTSCTPQSQTIARNANVGDTRYRLLYCTPGYNGNTWQPAIDLASVDDSIGLINQGVIGDYNLSVVTNQVNTNTAAINIIEDGLVKLRNQELKWDILQINWRPAQEVFEPSATNPIGVLRAQDKVWRRTPWRCNRFDGTTTTPSSDNNEGGLPMADWGDEAARYLQNASDNQESQTFTPPLLVSFDRKPSGDQVVWHVNCGTPDITGDTSGRSFWYVGASSKDINRSHGNGCRNGLGSTLTTDTNITYTHNPSAECRVFNIYAPSFNRQNIVGRWIAFTRPNDETRDPNGGLNIINVATSPYRLITLQTEIQRVVDDERYFHQLTRENEILEIRTSDANWAGSFFLPSTTSLPIQDGRVIVFEVNSSWGITVRDSTTSYALCGTDNSSTSCLNRLQLRFNAGLNRWVPQS
jgi:prepilin-type N-terminal cleavage/methylation domain-containing protein